MKEALRIAIVGVLGKGLDHVQTMRQVKGGVLSALVDRSPEGAAVAAKEGVAFFSDVRDLIQARAADAVICAVPHPAHGRVTVPCLEAGLHVLSEKPLAATPSDAKAIVDAAKAGGRVLAMMFQYRMRPAVKKAKELLDAGAVGPWHYAVVHHGINRSQNYYDARAWRGTWAGEGGGVLVNQAPHPIEIMMFFAGGFPRRVIAFNNHLRHRMQTEDASTAVLEYANGAHVALHADTIQLPPGDHWMMYGDRGILRVEGRTVTLSRISPDIPAATAAGPQGPFPSGVEVTSETHTADGVDLEHLGMMQDFVDAIRDGRPPMVDGAWALKCVELHAAIIASATTGKAVDFPPDHAQYDALLEDLKERATRATGTCQG